MCIERDDMKKGRDRDDLDLPFESYKIVGVAKDGRRIIQRMLHPHPLLLFVPHPQDVAVKSLISYLQGYLFYLCYIICRKACMCFSCTIKFFVLFLLIEETCCSKEMQRDEGG